MPTRRQLDPEIITRFYPEEGELQQGINKPGTLARWFVKENEYHDLSNFMPVEQYLQQTPAHTLFAQIAAPVVWMTCLSLNQASYLFCLCTNGHIYQVSLGGVIVDIAGSLFSVNCDIAVWQGTTILITDLNASKVYSWNGTTFATVFTSQPEQFITVYAGRLWMANQSTITFTAGGTFNSLGGDSGSFIITDSDCPPPVRALFAFGGSLYVFGYNWVKIYNGLFDSGSPPVLQFSQSTLTDEAGTYSKWSILPFGYSIMYASLYGIWNLLGSQPVFISEQMGGFFQNITLAGTSFSAAFAPILGIPCFMWQIQFADDNTYRILVQTYEQQPKWFTVTPPGNIVFITYGVNQTNGAQQAFGIDASNNIYSLFTNITANVTSVAKTKLLNLGNRIRESSIGRVGAEMVVSSTVTVTIMGLTEKNVSYLPDLQSLNPASVFRWTNGNTLFNWNNSGPFTWTGQAKLYEFVESDMPITCRKLGIDWTVVGAGALVGSFVVESQELPADWGQ